jgi:hypothetical protein
MSYGVLLSGISAEDLKKNFMAVRGVPEGLLLTPLNYW